MSGCCKKYPRVGFENQFNYLLALWSRPQLRLLQSPRVTETAESEDGIILLMETVTAVTVGGT
jgi:hypothetical protein